MSSSDFETERLLASLRDRIEIEVKASLVDAVKTALPQKPQEAKVTSLKVDKLLYDLISREIEATLIPLAEALSQKVERLVAERMARLESELKRPNGNEIVDDKMRVLESKLGSLEAALASSRSMAQSVPSNPYAEIERHALNEDWEHAWRLAVDVYNGVDFMVHLMGQTAPEEFFAKNPIFDPMLVLQICINACKEMLASDKAVALKLEVVSELILSVTNPDRVNLGHQFALLRELAQQLTTKLQSPRMREIFKIIIATERLLTPPVSIESTPMPTAARFSSPRIYP